MIDGYLHQCPKCYTPVKDIARRFHARGEYCESNSSGADHVHWVCGCGYKWMSYPR